MRPAGVSLIAALHWLRALGYALVACAVMGFTHLGARMISVVASDTVLVRFTAGLGKAVGLTLLVLAVVWVVLGLGIWFTANWARLASIGLFGLLLLWHLVSLMHFLTPWHILRVLIEGAVVVYLLLPSVKQVFTAA